MASIHIADQSKTLKAALLWARNHIDCGDPTLRDRVVERIDEILKDGEPVTGDDLKSLAVNYPLSR